MSQQHVTQRSHVASDEIDMRELFAVIWQGKWIVIAVTAIFTIASVFYVLSLPNIYKSEALLAPAGDQNNVRLPGQLGGLAALAGVNVGSGAAVDMTALALEIVKSRDFISRFIQQHIALADLIAADSWDINSNTLIYDSNIYLPETSQWVRDIKPPRQAEPSMQEAYKAFSDLLQVSQDKTTSMVKISIEHVSPYLAQKWLSLLITELNREMKLRDIEEAEKSIVYLQNQIEQTNIADLKTALFSLIEEQTKTLMLANVRDEYVLKIVDPAIVPEEKAKPARTIIVAAAVIIAVMLSVFAVLLINLFRKQS